MNIDYIYNFSTLYLYLSIWFWLSISFDWFCSRKKRGFFGVSFCCFIAICQQLIGLILRKRVVLQHQYVEIFLCCHYRTVNGLEQIDIHRFLSVFFLVFDIIARSKYFVQGLTKHVLSFCYLDKELVLYLPYLQGMDIQTLPFDWFESLRSCE